MPTQLKFNPQNPARKDVASLHNAFAKLRIAVAPTDVQRGEFGASTRDAIRSLQTSAGLPPTGEVSVATVAVVNAALEHGFYATNKPRTAKLHELLERAGQPVAAAERASRRFGDDTERALKAFQTRVGLPADGRMSEALQKRLESEAIKARFSTKTQVAQLHRTLLRVNRIAKISARVDEGELRSKQLGPSTAAVIREFQTKYKLPATGQLDPATLERIDSVAVSRPVPVKKLAAGSADRTATVRTNLWLNTTGEEVPKLQRSLAFLGHEINQKEFNTKTFGATTRAAVLAFQRSNGLPQTGHLERLTRTALNAAVERANPAAAPELPWRIRGSVRDALWNGRDGVRVRVLENTLGGAGRVLAEKRTTSGGFYDIPYDPPRNPANHQVLSPFHVVLQVVEDNGAEVARQALFNPTKIAWANFTQGDAPYRGTSEFDARMAAVTKAITPRGILDIEESERREEISYVALHTKIAPEDVMRLALSHHAARRLNDPAVGAAVFYAFVRQSLPPKLPGDVLHATVDWTALDPLVDLTVEGVVFMEPELQRAALDAAGAANLIPIATVRSQGAVLAALASQRQRFALERPLLVGNGRLADVVAASSIPAAARGRVADAFLAHAGFGPAFWGALRADAASFGGAATIDDFERTTQIGFVTKHHLPSLNFLRGAIGSAAHPTLRSTRDLARLTRAEWATLIQSNGGAVPDGTDGATPQERIASYAATLADQSALLFPASALTAELGRSAQHGLTLLNGVRTFLEANPDLSLRESNLDGFVKEKQANVPADVLTQAKVLQRVHRIAPDAPVTRALLESGIHSSGQIISMGAKRFESALAARGVDARAARTAYGVAEFQYAQALTRLVDYRFETHRTDPAAIVSHSYSTQELGDQLGTTADLATLFGSLDYCDCAHCQSLYSPAAWLSDALRFLNEQPSERVEGGVRLTVRDLLFRGVDGHVRRPDLGNIKLNCDNTNTPLPYIDLVCEILEAAVPAAEVPPGGGAPVVRTTEAFSFQTVGTAAELRAAPANVRRAAYDALRVSDAPMDSAFDLWQEETRALLAHLGVPRHELMRAFQERPGGAQAAPSDTSIAAEALGMSSHETGLVVTSTTDAARLRGLWGFDCTRATVPVEEFLRATRLDYGQLLELAQVRWISEPETGAGELAVHRPNQTCDLRLQTVTNLSPQRFDRIHRFLRLWRHTQWAMWELDLALRAERIGQHEITAGREVLVPGGAGGQRPAWEEGSLVRFEQLRAVQSALALPFEAALGLYAPLNIEVRARPDDRNRTIKPLYQQLFLNAAVINPVDPDFEISRLGVGTLAAHTPALLAALALNERDLDALVARTDGAFTLANLSWLFGRATLARGLGLTVTQLLTTESLWGRDPLASPKDTLEFIDLRSWISRSGLTIEELGFVLRGDADSPFGLREAAITERIDALREALRSGDGSDGQIVTAFAAGFSLRDAQARALLAIARDGGALLAHLKDPALTERNPDGTWRFAPTAARFPRIYDVYALVHKIALLLQRQKLTDVDDLTWLLGSSAAIGALDLATLPLGSALAEPLLPRWLVLSKWLHLRSLFPEPEGASLRGIFADAMRVNAGVPDVPLATLQASIARLTGWSVTDLQHIHTGLQLSYTADRNDYRSVDTWMRLLRCLQAAKRLGVDASRPFIWARRDDDQSGAQYTTAQMVRQTARAKYELAGWLSVITPIQDALRERKRDALIRYHVDRSLRAEPATVTVQGAQLPNPRHWRDANALLGYFLIDVEMCACQLTSRIKQAMSSVQMFVQRCLLNLERPHVEVSQEEREERVSMNSWRQWRYMKSYRLWEAARKVFFYPENWIEPELRDDKSPFFKELEDELVQGELTHERAEAAMEHYLQKVHEVARLEVLGACHEVDDDDPEDDLPPTVNVLHVVARTRESPAVYYYRRFDLSYRRWTAWEKVDVDITGDHLLPVVYNRKLFLFWLVVQEKPQKVTRQPAAQASSSATPAASPEAPKMLEIQLAWSARKDGGWTSKKLSRQKLVHPWERSLESYHLKSRYKQRENHLWLDVFISTSAGFNDRMFYDPYMPQANAFRRLTAHPFDERGRPWHASSFVFDGGVVDVKMKPLAGQYHMTVRGAVSSDLSQTTSLAYVHDAYGEAARAITPLEGPYEVSPRLCLPDGMHFRYNRLTNDRVGPNTNTLNVRENGVSRTLLRGARAPFEVVAPLNDIQVDTRAWGATPFFYQDSARAFFVLPEVETIQLGYNRVSQQTRYVFSAFYHPYSGLLLRELARDGADGLLTRRLQRFPHAYPPRNTFHFQATYQAVSPHGSDAPTERDVVDFSEAGANSIYNWETFFHAPFLVACRLSQNQRFEEAMRWFHYVFDPTNTEALGTPQRFWVTLPFFEQNADAYRAQRITNLLQNLNANLDQVRAWKNDPFKPHLIARYRPIAYQKAVVMRYIDNLIAWGDQLFRRDTMESINEATTLYVLAYELLGRRPVRVPRVEHEELTYNELATRGALDVLGNASVTAALESFTTAPVLPTRASAQAEPLPVVDTLYFCIPVNEKLLGYWDRVEDRLFKIRHCMNIEGVVRQLPLFEPPIDPALLVKAAAAGVDFGSVLDDAALAAGPYRYRTLAARAAEFCAEVRALGDKLLATLEKQDAEGLALLRSGHEIKLMEANKAVRRHQIDEAKANLAASEISLASAEQKRDYYRSRAFMNTGESVAMGLTIASTTLQTAIALGYILAGGLRFIPAFVVGASGFGGTPHVAARVVDGNAIGDAAENAVKTLQAVATALDKGASIASTLGSYERRKDDWNFQGDLAETEIRQIQKQVAAANLRVAIAEREIENLDQQIEQARTADEYMRSKYTNQQLYGWMLQQLTTVYFQSFKLAYDMARRAERAMQAELGRPELTFLQAGYWDSLKKGLLAGERLGVDLRRMETAWVEENRRELELTKHVSLAQLAPLALTQLKAGGACTVTLPEWMYDMDHPGHYKRRIKAVSVSIPAVVGPYTSVNCTLALTRNVVRKEDSLVGGYLDPLAAVNDARFVQGPVAVTSIATSHGREDSGTFELGLNDERFLPFEGAGAVSEWRLELAREHNAFDTSTISDVILHVRYTARASASQEFSRAAKANLATVLPATGTRLFALRSEFADAWMRFAHAASGGAQAFAFKVSQEHLPFHSRLWARVVPRALHLVIESDHIGAFEVEVTAPGSAGASGQTTTGSPYGAAHYFSTNYPVVAPPPLSVLGDWTLRLQKRTGNTLAPVGPQDVRNAWIIVEFARP